MSQEDNKKKILIIDDEDHVVTYLNALLQDNGYDTISASNGREGMEKMKQEGADLICLDITMPEQSGIRFYLDLKEDPQLNPTAVVIVTAVSGLGGTPEPFRQFIKTRKDIQLPEAFFSKPIEQNFFLETIANILNK